MKETVGKASYTLLTKDHAPTPVIDAERAMHEDYEKNVIECVDRSLKELDGDFFVIVLRKKERLMPNVFRNYFFARKSCPTPTYDQIVYKYHRKEDEIEFLWVVPDEQSANLLRDNALQVDPKERDLLMMVLSFFDKTLDKLAQKLNNEIDN